MNWVPLPERDYRRLRLSHTDNYLLTMVFLGSLALFAPNIAHAMAWIFVPLGCVGLGFAFTPAATEMPAASQPKKSRSFVYWAVRVLCFQCLFYSAFFSLGFAFSELPQLKDTSLRFDAPTLYALMTGSFLGPMVFPWSVIGAVAAALAYWIFGTGDLNFQRFWPKQWGWFLRSVLCISNNVSTGTLMAALTSLSVITLTTPMFAFFDWPTPWAVQFYLVWGLIGALAVTTPWAFRRFLANRIEAQRLSVCKLLVISVSVLCVLFVIASFAAVMQDKETALSKAAVLLAENLKAPEGLLWDGILFGFNAALILSMASAIARISQGRQLRTIVLFPLLLPGLLSLGIYGLGNKGLDKIFQYHHEIAIVLAVVNLFFVFYATKNRFSLRMINFDFTKKGAMLYVARPIQFGFITLQSIWMMAALILLFGPIFFYRGFFLVGLFNILSIAPFLFFSVKTFLRDREARPHLVGAERAPV